MSAVSAAQHPFLARMTPQPPSNAEMEISVSQAKERFGDTQILMGRAGENQDETILECKYSWLKCLIQVGC